MKRKINKPKILFVYDHKYENLWRDGLWAALNILEKDFEVEKFNIATAEKPPIWNHNFALGWGAFNSRVDIFLQNSKDKAPDTIKMGLCIAGNAFPPKGMEKYDVLFYETEWYKNQIEKHPHIIHAFGTNANIYNESSKSSLKIFDYLSVGSFSLWKRQDKIINKLGTKMVIGEIQKDNAKESMDIIIDLLAGGVMVSDMVYPTKLRDLYAVSKVVYIPANINGGGERAILDARSCGCNVEIEPDNLKLQELLNAPVWDENYYAEQLKKGIQECL